MPTTHKKLIIFSLTAIFVMVGVLGSTTSAQAGAWTRLNNAIGRGVNNFFGWSGNLISQGYHATVDDYGDAATEAARDQLFDDYVRRFNNSTDQNERAWLAQQIQQLNAQRGTAGEETSRAIQESVQQQTQNTEEELGITKGEGDAEIFGIIGNIVAWLLYYIVAAFNWIVAKEVDVLLMIMSYPIDLNLPVINNGWAIVRDVCNNFFIIIMLAIAVGTIFRVPSYRYREALPKLLIAAILVNFSKLIAGVFVDISQILMLSFAAPLVTIKGNNIILAALGLPDLVQFLPPDVTKTVNIGGATDINILNILAVLVWGIIVSFVAFIVIACIIIILVVRIVYLLFLAILSPIPFFANSFDKLKSYGNEWWSLFTKYLIVGPAMLFFLWLSFTIMGFSSQTANSQNVGQGSLTYLAGSSAQQAAVNRTATTAAEGQQEQVLSKAMTTEGMINFAFVIVLLVLSLVMGQRFGGAGAKFAGMGLGFLDKTRKKITTGAYNRTTGSRLGSAISRVGRMPVISMLGGGAIANYFDSQRAKVMDTKAKSEQTRISNIAKAGGFNQMSEQQLMRMANDMNRHTRLAAIQTLSNKGLLRDDSSLNDTQRAQRVKLINRAREDFASTPEFLQAFDDNVRKYSPNFALQSTMYTSGNKVNIEKLTSDLATGKLDLSKLAGSLNEKTAKLLNDSLVNAKEGRTAENALTKFIMSQTKGDQKEMEKVFGAMDDKVKKQVGEKVDQEAFRDKNTKKIDDGLREAYIKAAKNFNFGSLFEAAEKGKRDNFVSENGAFIASNFDANSTPEEVKKLIGEIGHALDPKHIATLTDRSKDLKKKVQDAFKDLADSVETPHIIAANTDLALKKAATAAARTAGVGVEKAEKEEKEAKAAVDRHKSIFQNTLLSGAEFDVGADAERRDVLKEVMKGKKKKEILEKMHSKNINQSFIEATHSELSGKDFEVIADRSKEDKEVLKEAFKKSIGAVASSNPDEAAKMIKKSLQADVFDSSIATSGGAAFDTALNGISTDQLSNMDDGLHTNNGVIANIISESDPNALVDWLSSRTAKNINLRKKVLSAIKAAGPGGSPNNLYERVDKKHLI